MTLLVRGTPSELAKDLAARDTKDDKVSVEPGVVYVEGKEYSVVSCPSVSAEPDPDGGDCVCAKRIRAIFGARDIINPATVDLD